MQRQREISQKKIQENLAFRENIFDEFSPKKN